MNRKSVMTRVPKHTGSDSNDAESFFFWKWCLRTLCAQATGAVVCGQCHPVAQPSSMLGLWSRTLSAALPLTVWTTHRPLAPITPAAIHWENKIQTQILTDMSVRHGWETYTSLKHMSYMQSTKDKKKKIQKKNTEKEIQRWIEPTDMKGMLTFPIQGWLGWKFSATRTAILSIQEHFLPHGAKMFCCLANLEHKDTVLMPHSIKSLFHLQML